MVLLSIMELYCFTSLYWVYLFMLTYKDGKTILMRHLTKVGRSIAWWFLIGTLFLAEGCHQPSRVIVTPHRVTFKFITDHKGKIHKYRYFRLLHDFGDGDDIHVEYCVRHKRWETISARWTKHGVLRFHIRRHKKDNRW